MCLETVWDIAAPDEGCNKFATNDGHAPQDGQHMVSHCCLSACKETEVQATAGQPELVGCSGISHLGAIAGARCGSRVLLLSGRAVPQGLLGGSDDSAGLDRNEEGTLTQAYASSHYRDMPRSTQAPMQNSIGSMQYAVLQAELADRKTGCFDLAARSHASWHISRD